MSRLGVVLTAMMALAGCSGGGSGYSTHTARSAQVTGTVGYVQRIALPPTAVIKVRLVDVSRADAPATVLGEQVIPAGGKQVPFAFAIAYDPAKIDPRSTYAVQARIEDESGRLLFVSDTHHGVVTRSAPTRVDMVLQAVGSPK